MPSDAEMAEALSELRELGWPVRMRDNDVVLSTTSGWCAVEVSQHLGDQVVHQLRRFQPAGPVAKVRRPASHYLFIAETDDVVDPERIQRLGAVLWTAPAEIPLPPSRLLYGECSWVVPPSTHARYLPSLSTVIWAMDATARHPVFSTQATAAIRRSVVAGGRIGTRW